MNIGKKVICVCAVAALIAFFDIAKAQNSIFEPIANLYVDYGISDVISADLNNDGLKDLVVTDNDSYNIKIYKNNGQYNFSYIATYDVGANPGWVIANDFNLDGKLDIAVSNDYSHDITIFWGNGDCSLQYAFNLNTDGRNGEAVSADIDSDPDLDIIVTVFSQNHIAYFINNGDGTFQNAQYIPLGGTPNAPVYSTDLDSDGDNDMAVTVGTNLEVYLNNGAGIYSLSGTYSLCSSPYSITGGDIDRDDDIDIIIANGYCNQIQILLNNGNAVFNPESTYAMNYGPLDVEVADLNQDNNLDIIVANKCQDLPGGNCRVLLGNGDGAFVLDNTYSTGQWPHGVNVADLNNDSHLDFAAANFGSGTVSIYDNKTTGILYISIAGNDTAGTGTNSNPYRTIQHGINIADNGDTILIDNGHYYERLSLDGKALVLGSRFLIDNDSAHIQNTIIDGDSTGSVIKIQNEEDSNTVIIGLTIQNGYAVNGGGIYCVNSNPTITNNIIINNHTDYDGCGIYCNQSSPIIRNNMITLNTNVTWNANSSGGGIYCYNGSNPIISNNSIINNSVNAYNGASGGGIACVVSSNPIIINNDINGNTSKNGGGGIFCYDHSDPYIYQNEILNNSCSYNGAMGGGIYCLDNCQPSIIGNTITGNYALTSGGGINCRNGSSPSIIENTINRNHVGQYYEWGDGGGISCLNNSNPEINGNIIEENEPDFKGGGIFISYSAPNVINNRINNNTSGQDGCGIYIDHSKLDGQASLIKNNIIARNISSSGVPGVYVHKADINFINNTVCNNQTSSMFGGIYIDSCSPLIINSIIYSNQSTGSPSIYQNAGSMPQIIYSDIEGGWVGVGNINLDPQFRDPTDNGYFLQDSINCYDPGYSPCIDAGAYYIYDDSLDCVRGLGTRRSDMGSHGGANSLQLPIIILSAAEIRCSLYVDSITVYQLMISNMGSSDLIDSIISNQPWLNIDHISSLISSFQTDTINITFNASGLLPAIYKDTITIISNDPEKPYSYLPVELIVLSPTYCSYLIGDINSDGNRIGGDVTYGVRYFKSIAPQPPDSCYMDSTSAYLYVAGDVNGNCEFRGSDITRLVAYFKGTAQLAYCHFFPTELPILRQAGQDIPINTEK